VEIELHMRLDCMDIVMSDDGVGFPFHGQYDLAELKARDLGPRSLIKRISLLRGNLVLTSSPSGSQLRVSVPLPDQAWPGSRRSAASA
jgi:signal transduction histidine kinase